jgi:hypothetical protein
MTTVKKTLAAWRRAQNQARQAVERATRLYHAYGRAVDAERNLTLLRKKRKTVKGQT